MEVQQGNSRAYIDYACTHCHWVGLHDLEHAKRHVPKRHEETCCDGEVVLQVHRV